MIKLTVAFRYSQAGSFGSLCAGLKKGNLRVWKSTDITTLFCYSYVTEVGRREPTLTGMFALFFNINSNSVLVEVIKLDINISVTFYVR